MTRAQTTLAAGTDAQAFCYDEQNRLVWATSQTATGPCGTQNTAGSLTSGGAQYTASYAYDALNRLTSSPLGTYAYASAHLHAASSVTSGSSTVYSAQYGNAGSMYCRAASSTTTCTGSTFSGAKMGYDHEGRLISWQNTWTNPTATAAYAYDGAGQRLAQSVTSGGTTSTTYYVGGGLEELTVSGTSSTLTKYEAIPGVCNVVVVGTGPSEAISYVTTDGLGSVSEALDSSGHVTAQQLYGPYGGGRYSSGTMPTAKGFTGQYADAAASGLDYYGARYYDPLLGQFTSADTDARGGLNRYAYVGGNPETRTDPSGHRVCNTDGSDCRPTPPHGSTTKDLGFHDLCGFGAFAGADVCGISDGNFGWFDLWGDVIETIKANGDVLWSYRESRAGPDECDTTCRDNRNEATRAKQTDSLRDKANGEYAIGAFIAAVGSILLGNLLGAAKQLLGATLTLAGAIAGLSALPGIWGNIFAKIGAVLSALATTLYAVIALSSVLYFVATALSDGIKAAFGAFTFGLGSIVQLGVGAGLSAIGWFFMTKGEYDLSSAQDQQNMSLGDWCGTYGSGQCQ